MKRLKDKIWREVTIKINRLVEQHQNKEYIENKCVAFLVTLEWERGRKTMFRADTLKELWKEIIHHSMIYK